MNATAKLAIVSDDAAALLDLLAPGEPVTFQTFDDNKDHKDRRLTRVLHGTLAQRRATLATLNARGAGIFWMVNAGNGKGRKAHNVQRIRALFVDLDGAPLEPVQSAPLRPHAIVESSPGRWHAYWRVSDCPLAVFPACQKALAERFDADAKVHDLPRVLRLPGFEHRKGKPFVSHLIALCDAPPYTLAEFRLAFHFAAASTVDESRQTPRTRQQPQRQRRTLPDRIPEGERNTKLLKQAASLLRRDNDPQAINDTLQKVNAEKCDPPLGADEVDGIVAQAVQYGSDGWSPYPDRLHDDMARLLPTPARLIVLTALRRFDGSNNGRITLPHAACRDIQGCADPHRFYRYRALAVKHGFLTLAREGGRTRDGATFAEYAIPERYLAKVGKTHTQRNMCVLPPPQRALTGVRAFEPAVSLQGRRRERNASEAQR